MKTEFVYFDGWKSIYHKKYWTVVEQFHRSFSSWHPVSFHLKLRLLFKQRTTLTKNSYAPAFESNIAWFICVTPALSRYTLYSVSQKSRPLLKLFAIFSFRLGIFLWNFANLLTIYIHTHTYQFRLICLNI